MSLNLKGNVLQSLFKLVRVVAVLTLLLSWENTLWGYGISKNNSVDKQEPDQVVGFCTNSRRWVDFMLPTPPKSCPYLGWQGQSHCSDHSCGYYEERTPTRSYKKKLDTLKRCFDH